jgi:SAM-dependent methyltransferase
MNKNKYNKEGYHLEDGFYWDKVYNTRHGQYYTKRVQNFINKFLNSDIKNLLDIGCGTGRFAIPICKKGYKVVGLDFDLFPLGILQKRDTDVNLIQGNAIALPFIDGSFDFIISIGVIKYIEHFDHFLDECHRVLKKDGFFIIESINKNNFRIIIKKKLHKDITDYCNLFSHKNFKIEFKKRGFEIIDIEGFDWIPFKAKSNSRLTKYFACAEKLLKLDKFLSLAPDFIICAKK